MSKTTTISIVAIMVLATILVTSLWYLSPAFAGPRIDETWLIAYNAGDTWDPTSASWVEHTFNGTLVDLNNPPESWDENGQNIIVIGGSKALANEVPWIGLKPEWYGIQRPNTYPDIQWDMVGDALHLITPNEDYNPTVDYDVGLIARGYDYTLRRWVVVVIGYTAYGTAYGSKLVNTQWNKMVMDNSYVIFQCTQHGGIEPTQWSYSDFDGIILEYGG